MAKGTKKTRDYSNELHSWKGFIDWLRHEEDEAVIKEAIMFEIENENRPAFIDRMRTRFNKVRAYRELKELEKLSGKVINVNYV